MTDQPYSFDEFSYGKISPLPAGLGTSTMAPWTQGEQWKIFSMKSNENHRMLVPVQEDRDKTTTSSSVEGYMRFNTVETNSKDTEPKMDGGRWPIQGSRFNDDSYFELESSSTFWDDLDHLDPTHNRMDNVSRNDPRYRVLVLWAYCITRGILLIFIPLLTQADVSRQSNVVPHSTFFQAINQFEHTSVSLSSSSSDSTQNNRSSHILSQLLVVLCLVLGKVGVSHLFTLCRLTCLPTNQTI